MYQSDYDTELQKRMEEFIRTKGVKQPGVQQRGPPPMFRPQSPPYQAAASPQPPAMRSGQTRDSSYLRTQSKPSGLGYDSGSKRPTSRVSPEPRENGASKRRHFVEDAKNESSDSDSYNGKEKQAVTLSEYDNYQEQLNQLVAVQMKLEVQLLKLKQEREVLKERGAQHEDSVMKENAVIQRGVKTQLQLTTDSLNRLQAFLSSCKIIPDQASKREEEKSVMPSESRRSNQRSPSRDETVEREKKKKKKKHRTRSSSDEESDRSVERKKKKKRKKEKRRNRDSSRSDDSDLERSSKRNISSSEDEKKKKKKRKKRKSGDSDSISDSERKTKESKPTLQPPPPQQQSHLDQLLDKTSDTDMMEILSKMSAAYTNVKNENKNLLETVEKLQAENVALRDLLSKVDRKLQKDGRPEKSYPKETVSKSHQLVEEIIPSYSKDSEKRRAAPPPPAPVAENFGFESEEKFSRTKESRHVRKFSEVEDYNDESSFKHSKKNEKVNAEPSWQVEERSRDKHHSKPAEDESKACSYFKESWREKEEEETRHVESDKKYAVDRESELRARLLEKRKNQDATMNRREESPPKPKKSDVYEEYDRTFGNSEGQAREDVRDQPREKSRRGREEQDRGDDRNDYRYNRERDQREKSYDRNDYQHEKERKKDSRYESDDEYDRKEKRRQRSVSRNDDYERGDERRDAYRDGSKSRDRKYQDERHKSKSKHSRRSRSRSSERYYEDKSSKKSEVHDEKKSKKPSRAIDEKNERICLEEWTPKQSQLNQDPTMVSLKKKLQQKEEDEERETKRRAEEEEERNRKRLLDIKLPSVADIPPPPPPPEQPPRNPVAIQWGQTSKSRITPDKTIVAKKLTTFVGKMPGRGFKKMTPEREWAKPKNSPPAAAPVALPPRPPSPTPPPIPVIAAPPAPSLNLQQILEAAQAHIKNRNKQAVIPTEPPPSVGEIEIPLPPLPAAQDKDPEALLDTRPPKGSTPKPEPEKSEMDVMIEKHKHVADVPAMGGYNNMYSQQHGGYNIPLPMEQYPPPPQQQQHQQQSWIPGYHDSDQYSGRQSGNRDEIPFLSKESDGDASELAMLGIDPDDLAGFGN